MNLPEKFQILKCASKELELSEDMDTLESMQQVYKEKAYYVAFVGRFSAGKSRLLNNLLGAKVLPCGVRETTPLLT